MGQGGFGSTLPHSGISVAKSTDGGETFGQQRVAEIRQIPSPIPPAGNAANDGTNSFRTGTVPTIGVTSNGTVHLAWGEWTGTDAEVRYVRSTNGGQTWSPAISMNDTPTGHQFFPSLVTDGQSVHVACLRDSSKGGPLRRERPSLYVLGPVRLARRAAAAARGVGGFLAAARVARAG